MKNLDNKRYVVTGGNSGIGYATAKQLIENGASVIITGRNQETLEDAAKTLGAIAVASDQSSLTAINNLVERVDKEFGKIDGLFVNAGIASFNSVENFDEELYDKLMEINVKGVYFTVQKLIPLLKDGSSIVLNTSVNATLAVPGSSVYGMTKAALLAFNRILAAELAPKKIRVNAVSPGPVSTPLYGKLGLDNDTLSGFSDTLTKKIALNRFGEPGEIANLVRFLLSDESSFITGTEQVIDGGLLLNTLG